MDASTFWNRYNNPLAMEIQDFEADMNYMESLPDYYR